MIDLEGAEFSRIGDMTISDKGVNLMTSNTTKVVLPTSSNVKEIPADFMNGSTNIRAICIPSNIEIIRTRAFYTIDYVWTTPGDNDPEGDNTLLDNGAVYSDGEKFATNVETHKETANFNYCAIPTDGSYTFSSNLKLIETAAFANTQPHVKDVYVLNVNAPECHVDAFNTAMYNNNGGYSPKIIKKEGETEGIITRDSYTGMTMLHYPRQTTTPNVQRYTDPTRSYSIATGERDGKGAMLYFPNQSEFIRAYVQGTFGYTWNAWNPVRDNGSVINGDLTGHTTAGWTAAGQTAANGLFDSNTKVADDVKKYYTFYDVTGTGVTAPTDTYVPYYQVNWDETAYSTANPGNLYPQAGTTTVNGETTEADYRGWHQFVLTAYAANSTLEEIPLRSYITDNEWWTICSTVDLTKEDIVKLYGRPADGVGPELTPYVSKLRYVRRTYYDKTIHLNFSET